MTTKITMADTANRFKDFMNVANSFENQNAILGAHVSRLYNEGGKKLVAKHFDPLLVNLDNRPKIEGALNKNFQGAEIKRLREVFRYNTDNKLTIQNKDKTKIGLVVTTPEKRAKKEVKLAVAVKALDLAITVINQTTMLDDGVKVELSSALTRIKEVLAKAILTDNGVAPKSVKSAKVAKVA
jgi:hypothetical protein